MFTRIQQYWKIRSYCILNNINIFGDKEALIKKFENFFYENYNA